MLLRHLLRLHLTTFSYSTAPSTIRSLAASYAHLAAGTDHGTLLIFALGSPCHHRIASRRPSAHAGPIADVDFLSPADDGVLFSLGAQDATLKTWDLADLSAPCSESQMSPGLSYCLNRHPSDATLIAVGREHGKALVLDLNSGRQSHAVAGHAGSVLSVCWSPQSQHILATGGEDGTVRVWDVRRSASCVTCLDPLDNAQAKRQPTAAHAGAVTGLAFALGGALLVSQGSEGQCRTWVHLGGGAFRASMCDLPPHQRTVKLNRKLALHAETGLAWLVDRTGVDFTAVNLLEGLVLKRGLGAGHVQPVCALALGGPDLAELFSASADGVLLAWSQDST